MTCVDCQIYPNSQKKNTSSLKKLDPCQPLVVVAVMILSTYFFRQQTDTADSYFETITYYVTHLDNDDL